ncbi:ATP-binding cassette domain-containing protein [Streptomyces sp. NPDC056661]|uniref:ATP-binding cassette domain-containing protein n=1 Tax=Streptomyces sp. NPDC056661 TaxID=3345898 RepID=UPI0036B421B5
MLLRLPTVAARAGALAWRADARLTVCLVVVEGAAAAASVAGLLASVGVLRALFSEGATPERIRSALPSLVLVGVLLAVRALLDTGKALAQGSLTPRIGRILETELLALTATVKLEAVDDARWADAAQRANARGLPYAEKTIIQVTELGSALLGLLGTAGVLSVLHPLLVPLLMLSVLPQGLASIRSARLRFLSQVRHSALQRRKIQFTWLLHDRDSAAELRVCTAQDALLAEHRRLAERIEAEEIRLNRREATTGLTGRSLGGLGSGITYVALVWLMTAGWLPLAAGGGAVLALQTSRVTLTRLVLAVHQVFEHALWLDDVLNFQQECRALLPPRGGRRAPDSFDTITVEHVSYTYPGSATPALCDVSMTLSAGTTVAFVGTNGSGKSTMSKVIAGLYQPQSGSLRWDDTDLAAVEAESIQAHVSMVLQDPTPWPLTALANISIGAGSITACDPVAVHHAAKASGADKVIATLPETWRSVLSKKVSGGVELSAGNWAKIAVARGLYKRARIFILDEPTASMDPHAEHAIYQSAIRQQRHPERIIILISHRLASVVDCDRIFVFNDGGVVESGTHGELMSRNGTYHEMFTLQAAAYREPRD